MGVFTKRPSAYTPPLDGSTVDPTFVGGAPAPSPPARPPAEPQPRPWRIELRHHAITGHRSHAILALVGRDGSTRAELNGLSNSRNFGKDENGKDKFFDANQWAP